MRRVSFATLLIAALLWAGPAAAPAATKGTECEGAGAGVTSANLAFSERSLLCLVNVYRASNGLAPLTEDASLVRAARGHSEYMEATNQFEHTGIGDGTPTSRAQDAGFRCDYECVGENIAYSNFPGYSPTEMFELWRNSPGHNANMLDGAYLTAGMGFALGGNFGLTGTQNFAVVSNGATGTASDLLTSSACRSAGGSLDAAEKRVAKAKRKLRKADSPKSKRRARGKLRRAKADVKAEAAVAEAACDLTY